MNPVFPMVSQLVLNNMHKLMSTTLFVCQLDASKLDYNWRFLVEFFATFAPVGVPSLAKFKAWFFGHKNSIHPVRLVSFSQLRAMIGRRSSTSAHNGMDFSLRKL